MRSRHLQQPGKFLSVPVFQGETTTLAHSDDESYEQKCGKLGLVGGREGVYSIAEMYSASCMAVVT